ncbi:MAG: PilT protein domain protein [Ignavibacteria bacterium]|nr:PilT protein domain protein [Ignavibacteria bacterium]
MKYQIVIDTNVIVTSMLSKKGASYKLVGIFDKAEKFDINITVPLFFEYEYALKKQNINYLKIEKILGYLAKHANQIDVHYLWRPYLPDTKDDCVLEAAINSSSQFIITYNKKDFKNVFQLGIKIVNPKEFLEIIGEI